MLNDQSNASPYNETQRSTGFVQKQLPEVFCKKGVFKFHRKTPVLESFFNNVGGLQACNFIKKILQHWCFPMKIAKFLRIPILRNISERLLLFVSPQNTIKTGGGEFECKVFF